MSAIGSLRIGSQGRWRRALLCRKRSVLRRGSVQARLYRCSGIAGVSFAASTGGSSAGMPFAPLAPAAGSVEDILWQKMAAPFQIPTLDEEEISDVSLATFSVYDTDLANPRSGLQLAAFRAGCGCGHGCGGCRGCCGVRACGGRACGFGCRGCGGWRGCGGGWRGCSWGGCGGCGGCGVVWGWGGAAACPGGGATSYARLGRLAIALTQGLMPGSIQPRIFFPALASDTPARQIGDRALCWRPELRRNRVC